MGRHRFEDQIKEKLGPREIKPTEGSWEKLRLRLDAEEKTPKPLFWWIGIAATLAGGLLIAGLVFNNPGSEETPIADVPSKDIIEEKVNTQPVIGNNIASENVKTETASSVVNKKLSTAPTIAPLIKGQAIANSGEKENEEVFQKEPATMIASNLEKEEINKKVEEILVSVLANELENGSGNPNEIDALLSKAALQLSIEKQNSRLTTNIDPEDLLYDVEMELEQSFRDKVFEILKEGYLKARTAVVNRNYPN